MSLPPLAAMTISPRRLQVDRPPFRSHRTYPLHMSEFVNSDDPLPLDWIQDPVTSSPASAPEHESGIPTQPAAGLFGVDGFESTPVLPVNTQLIRDDHQPGDGGPSESIGKVDWTLDGVPSNSPRQPLTPVKIHRLIKRLPSGASDVTSSSVSSADTPLSERRKKNHLAFLARTRQYQATPTPHLPLSEARMLAPTPTPSQRKFALHVDADDDDDDDVDEEEKETCFDGQVQRPAEPSELDRKEEEAGGRSVATVALNVKGHHDCEEGPEDGEGEEDAEGEEEGEAGETPAKSSEYKATEESEEEQSDDDVYTPRRSARNANKSKRGQSRVKPYATSRMRKTRHKPAASIATPKAKQSLDLRKSTLRAVIPRLIVRHSSPLDDPSDEDATAVLRGEDRIKIKVREFREYLAGPKRQREPRFDMKVFHWAMSDCPELKWQSGGQGVVIADIGKFYKDGDVVVLHKEVRERMEQRGKRATKRDFPGKTSFERQLSGYGFTRSTEGKTMYINRPDLRRDDKKLLGEVRRVWNDMSVAVKAPKVKAEPANRAALLSKLNVDLEVRLADKELELAIYQQLVKALLAGDQPASYHLQWACENLGIAKPILPAQIKSSPGVRDDPPLSSTREGPFDSDSHGTRTPLRSIDEFNSPRPAKRTRRSTQVKQEWF